jgi:hypothetical protein
MKNCLALLVFVPFISAYSQSVDPLTGRASVSIPLGSISAYDLSVGVNLFHHGGAIRLNEGPGNAGVGWNVSFGGYSIYREVHGLPDDYSQVGDTRKGWLYNSNAGSIQGFTPAADDNLAVCTDESSDFTFISGKGYASDTEPDVFYFNAPGVSGKFVFGSDGLPKLIPYQDIDIGFSSGTFTIKTNTGLVYTFDGVHTTTRSSQLYGSNTATPYFNKDYSYYINPITYTSGWDLTKIESNVTGAVATYSYLEPVVDRSAGYTTSIQPFSTTDVDTLYSILDSTKYSLPTKITVKNYSIKIAWVNRLVDRVTIMESETGDSVTYDLRYTSVRSSLPGDSAISKPFLTGLRQMKGCESFPPYKFTYALVDTVNNFVGLPWKQGWGEDYFGYYNGYNQSKNIPTVYFYSSESDGRRLRVTPIPGITPTETHFGTDAFSREVDATNATKGALESISSPTGGITTFTYEGNKYVDSTTGQELQGPGIRVASITTSGGEFAYGKTNDPNTSQLHAIKKTYQYNLTDGGTTTSGTILYPPVFAFIDGTSIIRTQQNMGPGSEVYYSRVKELIPGHGSTVYVFDVPNAYPSAATIVPQSKIARPSGGSCAALSMKNGVYTYPFAPAQDLDYTRGLLRKVSQYTEAGVLTNERRLNYTQPQTSTYIKGLKFEEIRSSGGAGTVSRYYYSSYLIPVNLSKILTQEVVKTIGDVSAADSVKVTTAYTYNSFDQVTQSTRTNADGSIVASNMKYARDYSITSPSGSDLQAVAINKLNTTNRKAQLIESWQSFTPIGGTTVVTNANLALYKDYGTYVWPDKSKTFPQGFTFTPSTATSSTFSSDVDYVATASSEFAGGLPVNQTDLLAFSTSSVHYATGTGTPVATFFNCKSENAIYEGFEMATGRGLSGGTATTPGWTGLKAISLDNSFTLSSASVTKGENNYRVSFWAYGSASNIIVTVKTMNGATEITSDTFKIVTPNKWIYKERFINTTSVTSTFTFKISSPTAIRIDEFIAMPKSARVTSSTFLPLTGPTSQTDDRGNSSVTTYDLLGRPSTTFDRNRNLVAKNDYGFRKDRTLDLEACFTTDELNYILDEDVHFHAADASCISGVTYSWKFIDPLNNVSSASGIDVTHVFGRGGQHSVTLTVSKAGYVSRSFTQMICVIQTELIDFGFIVSPSTSVIKCDPVNSRVRTFTAKYHPAGATITWYITDVNDEFQKLIIGALPPEVTINGHILTYDSPERDYQVMCVVTYEAVSLQCPHQTVIAVGTQLIDWVDNSPCQ